MTMRIERTDVVGSGYIQFEPQRPFAQPVISQPMTIALEDERNQHGRGRGGGDVAPGGGGGGYGAGPMQQQYRQQQQYMMQQQQQQRGGGGGGGQDDALALAGADDEDVLQSLQKKSRHQ